MKSTDVNILRLKHYYNQEKFQVTESNDNRTNKDSDFKGRNFIEYYIDGKGLINELGKLFWNKDNSEDYFESNVGFLASFTEDTDLVIVPMLLILETEKEIRTFVEKYASFEVSDAKFEKLYEDFQALSEGENTFLYICFCGDIYCGGIGTKIKKDEQYYYWTFGDDELLYRFDIDQYESEMIQYLVNKKWN